MGDLQYPIARSIPVNTSQENDHRKTHMNILLSKLLGQTLRQCPGPELSSSKCTCCHVSPQTSSSSSENQGALLACRLINCVVLESENRLPGKSKGGYDVDLECLLDILRGDLKERLPHTMCRVINRCADGKGWGGKVRSDGLEHGCDILGGVRCYGKRCGLGLVCS